MNRVITTFCNLFWLASALPRWCAFQLALWFPRRTQQRVLRRILRRNSDVLGNTLFQHRETQDYETLRPDIEQIMRGGKNELTAEPIILLEPTGGSSSGTKLIPYTRSLKKEFQRAVDPWIAGLFIRWPSLLFGRHYWSITPSTKEHRESVIPIGFDTDSAYLGRFQQFMSRQIMAVPPHIAEDQTPEQARFLTLVHLLNTPDLRLISVWHPSLLTEMMNTLHLRFDELLQALPERRAKKLRAIGCTPALIWDKLKVISCWSGTTAHLWVEQLQSTFPHTIIQPKGLVATEGITSIPLGQRLDVSAIRSHYYEFECEETRQIFPLWEVQPDRTYHLILTTGGGLYRYRTHDLVRITGLIRRTPCIHFLTRNNMTSDLFGEKITLAHAEQICSTLPCKYSFAMIAPESHVDKYRYALYLETDSIPESIAEHLENRLSENYHYCHARNLGQLEPSVVHQVKGAAKNVFNRLSQNAKQPGSIKITALRQETDWNKTLLNKEEQIDERY
ncbi:MAG: GH3 auxin-responsive promoter family protein [Pontiellaceae bacterium]|nr:GH3 auxin-responsive promoter family protein [Pontiellaceae bacterium]